eukprot:48393-Eustigmatos_ZCMA.PRE.1
MYCATVSSTHRMLSNRGTARVHMSTACSCGVRSSKLKQSLSIFGQSSTAVMNDEETPSRADTDMSRPQ